MLLRGINGCCSLCLMFNMRIVDVYFDRLGRCGLAAVVVCIL